MDLSFGVSKSPFDQTRDIRNIPSVLFRGLSEWWLLTLWNERLHVGMSAIV